MTTQGFPLPLTPFERYMVLDDRPSHPTTFLYQCDFDGVFGKEALERAVTRALARHPMLRTTVRGGRAWREPSSAEEVNVVRWLPWSEETPDEASAPLHIGTETGLRFFVQQNAERARWTLQAHHAATDGKGLLCFMRDVAAAYAAEYSDPGADPGWEPSAPGLLAGRGASWRAVPAATSAAPRAAAMPPLGDVVGFLFRRPERVRTAGTSGAGPGGAPAFVHHTFEAPVLARIRRTARAHDASVNDVLVCTLFQTLAEWNLPGGASGSGRWLRVMVPTDLRTADDAGMGAANVLGYAFLDRRARDCGEPLALLRSVSGEMRAVRLHRLGHRILDGIAIVDRMPGLLRLILRRRATLATAVLSNVGRIDVSAPGGEPPAFDARHPRLRRVLASVPLRPGTRAGFAVSQFQDTLTLTLRADPRYLDREAAEALLAAFVGKVHDISRAHSPS